MTQQGAFAPRTDLSQPFARPGPPVVQQSYTTSVGDWSGLVRWLQTQAGGDEEITIPYAQSWLIYACASVRARALAQLRPQLWTDPDDSSSEVKSGPLWELLRQPHPAMSSRLAWMLTQLYLDLHGEALWLLCTRSGDTMRPTAPGQIPEEVLVIPGPAASAELDVRTNLIRAWHYGRGVQQTVWPVDSVWHLRMPDPYAPLRGFGPAQAAARIAAKEFQAERYDEALTKNFGVPSLIFSSDQTVTAPQAKQAAEQITSKLSSSNAGKPLILGNGLKLENPAFNPSEMGHKDLRNWGLDACLAVFGVTRPLIGLTEGVNFASASEARKVFWADTMIPHAEFIAQEFEEGFIARLRGRERAYSFGWDFSRVAALRTDLEAKIKLVKELVGLGVKFNKAAELAEWEIDPLTDSDFEEPEPIEPPAGAPAAAPAPAQQNAAPRVVTLAKGPEYLAAYRKRLEGPEKKLARRSAAVLQSYVLAVRKRIEDLASGAVPLVLDAPRGVQLAVPPDIDPELIAVIAAQLPKWQDWVEPFTSKTLPLIEQVFLTAAADMAAELSLAVPSMGPGSAELVSFIATKRVKLAEGVLSRLAEQVTTTIAETLAANGPLAPADLIEGIKQTLEQNREEMRILLDRIPERAQRIARTEMTSTANLARVSEMRAAGIQRHEWVSERDEASRDTHAALHGVVKPIGEEFRPNLRMPGDPQAPASEVVNCGCAVAPYIEEAQ